MIQTPAATRDAYKRNAHVPDLEPSKDRNELSTTINNFIRHETPIDLSHEEAVAQILFAYTFFNGSWRDLHQDVTSVLIKHSGQKQWPANERAWALIHAMSRTAHVHSPRVLT